MNKSQPFKWRHFQAQIILLCVRLYLRYPLSYRQLEEMMLERGLSLEHTTIYRWVQAYSPEIEKRCRPYLKPTNDSWKIDETYIKVKRKWMYLFRAIDSNGETIDFLLSARRDLPAVQRFFRRSLGAQHSQQPRVINADKNPIYPGTVMELQKTGELKRTNKLRQIRYLNNLIEQDHRFIKRRVNPASWHRTYGGG